MTRSFGAGAFALAMLVITSAAAKPCVQTWPPGTFKVIDPCPAGHQRAGRHHHPGGREGHKARRPAAPAARSGEQTDNDGRLIVWPAGGRAGVRSGARSDVPGRLSRSAQAVRHDILAPEILPHPAGCPRRAFCGCGAAVRVFGAPIRTLWRAAAWLRFPPALPAPDMVAVRPGHVFVIERVLGPDRVLAWDANSGRGLTRRHVRSLAGFSVRNPRAAS